MPVAGLGLLVAVVYGAGDFLGGLASRRLPVSLVVLWSQGTGLLGLMLVVPLVGGSPSGLDIGLGAVAGVAGLCGVLLLYRGLSVGRMSVVAPVTAVAAAFVTFVVGVLGGEGLPPTRLAGAVLALGGVALVSRDPSAPFEGSQSQGRFGAPRAELGLALGAGLAFGGVFVLLSNVGDDAGLWPILTQRVAAVSMVLASALVARMPRRVTPGDLRIIVPTGLCDAGANVLFILASRAGDLSVVGVLSSLYPAATVLLAALVLKERLNRAQDLGLLLAAAGVVLLAV